MAVAALAVALVAALGLAAVLLVGRKPADPYGATFDAWAAKSRPDTAIMVVRKAGQIVSARGHRVRPDSHSFIGSMSKAITGACVATLIRDGRLSFATPMRDALAGFFQRHGRPADRRFEAVTVEQLLVHRSGLLGNPDGDPIHAIWQDLANRGQAHVAAPQRPLAQQLKHPLKRAPGAEQSYSNTGYVALTAIIEERSGRPYEAFCQEAVLSKLGVRTAHLHPDWRTFSGAGGWYITGADYLAFLEAFDPLNRLLGDSVKSMDRSDADQNGRRTTGVAGTASASIRIHRMAVGTLSMAAGSTRTAAIHPAGAPRR